MGLIKTKGIVIAAANSADNDKVLTILTEDLGKISVFCRGAKKNKSALLNVAEYLSFSEFILFKSPNDKYSLNSAEVIQLFYNLRMDIEKLNYATVMTKIIYDTVQENQYSEEILQLLLNSLYVLSETDKDCDLVLSIFEIRMLALLGFTPRVNACVSCGAPMQESMEEFYFSIKDDGVKCEVCDRLDKGAIKLNKTSFMALIYILTSEPKKLFSFEIPEESINELKLLAQIYLSEKLEKEYKVIKY
ncbi:MAG: DNA repair protein RecO [Clostridia bacterium]|nr:DNA repair protein RecO [Clostridia bacterium]